MTGDLVARALTALRHKNYAAAREFITAYGENAPFELQHYLIEGLAELALEDWTAAQETFTEAIQDFPHQPQLWFNLGIAQENLGALDDAEDSYRHSLDLKSDQADACGNLSNVLRRLGCFAEAEEMAHRAYELGAPKAQALNALGLALGKQGRFEAAAAVFTQARELDASDPLIPANMANLAVDQLNLADAWPLFAAARALAERSSPPAQEDAAHAEARKRALVATLRRDEGMARLLAGETEQGWALYDARLDIPGALRVHPSCPRWQGEPLAGKTILLVAEQGFGDTIQFCRYGRLLSESGASLVWMAPKPLHRLLASNLPGLVLREDDAVPDAHYWAPLMSLPRALKLQRFSDAPTAPYLAAPAEPRLPAASGLRRRIGLVWTASPTNDRDYEKSMPLAALDPLWKLGNVEFCAPFVNPRLDLIAGQPIRRLDSLITDFADTAALLAQLDGLVTVCTAAAHLAGALGLRTWLLLPHCPDWRWGLGHETTPWYPSVTLLRQPAFADWATPVERLADILRTV